MKAQRKDRKQGIDADSNEKPSMISCQAIVAAMPVPLLFVRRYSIYFDVEATEKAATKRRKEKTNTMIVFLDRLMRFLETK